MEKHTIHERPSHRCVGVSTRPIRGTWLWLCVGRSKWVFLLAEGGQLQTLEEESIGGAEEVYRLW